MHLKCLQSHIIYDTIHWWLRVFQWQFIVYEHLVNKYQIVYEGEKVNGHY